VTCAWVISKISFFSLYILGNCGYEQWFLFATRLPILLCFFFCRFGLCGIRYTSLVQVFHRYIFALAYTIFNFVCQCTVYTSRRRVDVSMRLSVLIRWRLIVCLILYPQVNTPFEIARITLECGWEFERFFFLCTVGASGHG